MKIVKFSLKNLGIYKKKLNYLPLLKNEQKWINTLFKILLSLYGWMDRPDRQTDRCNKADIFKDEYGSAVAQW